MHEYTSCTIIYQNMPFERQQNASMCACICIYIYTRLFTCKCLDKAKRMEMTILQWWTSYIFLWIIARWIFMCMCTITFLQSCHNEGTCTCSRCWMTGLYVCMFVCHVCLYVCMWVVCMYVMYVSVYMYVCICASMYLCMYVCTILRW